MRFRIFLALLLLLGAGGVGCSTLKPYHQRRMGVLDRWYRGERGGAKRASADSARSLAGEAGRGLKGPARVLSSSSSKTARSHVDSDRHVSLRKQAFLKWPVQNPEITSPYGHRGRTLHEGIDLRADSGTSVFAAQAGKVLYAGTSIRGYGKMIVLKHDHSIATVYGHNSRLLVQVGDTVSQGQKIALSGNSGRSSGPHVHFEVRDGVVSIDPLDILPSRGSLSALTPKNR
jgi:murein DD-endopeptidase MepM/ murein hydrolase activator NlpD